MRDLPKDLHWSLFDLDGTLTDSAPGILRCVQYALEQCGTPEPDTHKPRPFIGPPPLDSFQQFCGMSPERAAYAVAQYRERFSKIGMFENSVYPGIPRLLERLTAHGYVLAVATSKPEVYTRQIMEHFALTKYFTVIAGSDIHKEGETKADVMRLAARRLGLPEQRPSRTVMIGDRKHDVLGAKECGVPCIGVGMATARRASWNSTAQNGSQIRRKLWRNCSWNAQSDVCFMRQNTWKIFEKHC